MGNESERRGTRRREIGDRITDIHARINDLQQAQRGSGQPVVPGERLAQAQHHAAVSKATARRALAASMDAFLRAASAHERCASLYERAAAAGDSSKEQHRTQAAFHRAAAAADRQRAVTTQSRLSRRTDNREGEREETAILGPTTRTKPGAVADP